MKIARNLLIAAAVLNAVFFVFHLWVGWRLHGWPVDARTRSLLELLNGGGALFVLFLAIATWHIARAASLAWLAHLVVVLGGTVYLLRAAAELVVPPRFTPAIFATCLVTGLLYAVAFALRRSAAKSGAVPLTSTPAPG